MFTALAQTYYVTPNGAGTGDGSTWLKAISATNFPVKLASAASGAQFWVAAGTLAVILALLIGLLIAVLHFSWKYITGFFFGTVNFNPSGTAANLTTAGSSAKVFVAKWNV